MIRDMYYLMFQSYIRMNRKGAKRSLNLANARNGVSKVSS